MQGDPHLLALLTAHTRSAPFDRIEWAELLRRHCGMDPRIVVASHGEQRAALLLCGSGHLRSAANWYSFRVRPLVSEDADALGLLTAVARNLKSSAWRVTLSPLPDEDGSARLLEQAFERAGWSVSREACDVNHVLALGGRNFAEYLAARPGQVRTTLKRKAGKVRVQLLDHFDPGAWAAYEAIYADSWKPEEGSPEFLHAFAQAEGAVGRLRMALAYAEDRPVAAQFWTVEGGTAFIHKLAHIEDAKPFSPGTTLSAALFEQVIDRDRVELVDFGTGNDGYKRDWMEAVRPRFRIDCLNPARPRAWPYIARCAFHRLAPTARAN